jgi:regulatory protein
MAPAGSEIDPPDNIPGPITAIEPQKRRKDRFSVFVNNAFLIGLSGPVVQQFKLKKGVEMTPSLFTRLQQAEYQQTVKDYLLGLLARRDHARRELQRKARRKDYPDHLIQLYLDEFEKRSWIDETKFARSFALDKYRLNNWGPNKIRAALYQKGISNSDIDQAIAHLEQEENVDSFDHFFHLVLKRKSRFLREEDPRKRRKKVFDYLARKGYRSDQIFPHLDQLLEAIEH